MTPTTVRRLESLFQSDPQLVAGPVEVSEVETAEKALAVPFGDEYRSFLVRYGAAIVGSLPILGLRRADAMAVDTYSVVDVTVQFRADGWPSTDEWAVFSVDHSGNPIGLSRDGTVWIYDHDAGEVSLVARSFEQFLIQLLDRLS